MFCFHIFALGGVVFATKVPPLPEVGDAKVPKQIERLNQKSEFSVPSCPTKNLMKPPDQTVSKINIMKEINELLCLMALRTGQKGKECYSPGNEMTQAAAKGFEIKEVINRPPASADAEAILTYKKYHQALQVVFMAFFHDDSGKKVAELGSMSFKLPRFPDVTALLHENKWQATQVLITIGGGLQIDKNLYRNEEHRVPGDRRKTFRDAEPNCNWTFISQLESVIGWLDDAREIGSQTDMKWWKKHIESTMLPETLVPLADQQRIWKTVVAFLTPMNFRFAPGLSIGEDRASPSTKPGTYAAWTYQAFKTLYNHLATLQVTDNKGVPIDGALRALIAHKAFFDRVGRLNYPGKMDSVNNQRERLLGTLLQSRMSSLKGNTKALATKLCTDHEVACFARLRSLSVPS
ncbi:MAG: hypothetical protein KVP17_000080 [Porospora cf. gigantea B]|nr:MAG: hypothetical protein KVP17_000080 [Porospora cf. gigantea B]